MKGIMYHYVRDNVEQLPYFVYLHIDCFEKQINYFQNNYRILSQEELEWCVKNKQVIENSVVLTFDDGIVDHYQHVYPLLKEKGLWGIFYISTKPYEEKKLLDVHRIHYLLGRYGGKFILDKIKKITKESDFIEGNREQYSETTYVRQSNDEYTKKAKQTINYYLKPERRGVVLDELMHSLCDSEEQLFESFYLQKEQIHEMIDNGMSIASHGHSHTLFSNMSKELQEKEIETSLEILVGLTNNRVFNSFCFPYGGKQSYTKDTIEILKKNNVEFSFSVESRDISTTDLGVKHELPRFDCNEFDHGKATIGIK